VCAGVTVREQGEHGAHYVSDVSKLAGVYNTRLNFVRSSISFNNKSKG